MYNRTTYYTELYVIHANLLGLSTRYKMFKRAYTKLIFEVRFYQIPDFYIFYACIFFNIIC